MMPRHKLFCLALATVVGLACRPFFVEELPDHSPAAPAEKPTPEPTATPKPVATATAASTPTDPPSTPTPGGGDEPVSGGVEPPPSPPAGATTCNMETGVFVDVVVGAETIVKQQHPDYFRSTTCVKDGLANSGVSWRDYYTGAILQVLNASGVAAVNDGGGEIAIKNIGVAQGTGFSEQYHILISNACVHPCPDCYRATCRPAWF